MSISRGLDKDVVHIHNGILFSHKKEWKAAICSNVNVIMLSKINQTEKEKYYVISLICRIQKNNTKECICKTETHSQIQKTN